MKIWVKIFLKCPLWSTAAKLGNIWTKIFLQEVEQESCTWKSICQILILTLWLVTPPCFLLKISQILQKVIAFFPKRGRADKNFILTYLDSSVAEVFPKYCLFFSILATFRRKRGVRVGPKVITLGPFLFHKYSDPSKVFKQCFCLLQYYLSWVFRQYWTILGE